MLEKKDFDELRSFKQRLQMHKISDIHTQTRDGAVDEEAVWREHEEHQRILAAQNNLIVSEKISPHSQNEFRKQIYGTHGVGSLGMRTSGKNSSVVTQPYVRNSQHMSDASDHKLGASKLSKSKLKEESSLNKSSREKDEAATHSEGEDEDSGSEDSGVFVTKAANISSIDEPADSGFDTMKHNDKNIIAAGQAGVVGSSH